MPGFARILAVLAFLVSAVAPLRAEPSYPAFTGLVVDDAHVLTPWDQADLTRRLEDLQTKTGVQFAVATVSSLGGDEIEPYANALFRKWGVGQKGTNSGILLVLAPNERKLRFEVGYGLEGTMTDAQSKLILRNDMVPKLKAGDPAGALKVGVEDGILVLTKDKANLPERLKPKRRNADEMSSTTALFIAVFIFVFVLIMILSVFQNRRRGRGWSRGWTWGAPGGFIATSGDSSSGGFSDSGSSGGGDSGFSGGGGGDSGGGGASDSY